MWARARITQKAQSVNTVFADGPSNRRQRQRWFLPFSCHVSRRSGLYFRLQIRAPAMEDGMKLWRALLITILLAFCTTGLQAGPHVIIHDPVGAVINPVGLVFTFTSDGSGGGLTAFTNASGFNWVSLDIFTPAPLPILPITCSTDNLTFSACSVQAGQFGFYATVQFTGPPGIMNGNLFYIDLGAGGWTPNAEFLAIATPTSSPEPGTILLLAGGMASILARKKFF